MLWKSEAFCLHAGFSDQSYSTCATQSLPLDLVDTVGRDCPEYNCCSMRDATLHFLKKTFPEWQCHFTFLLAMPHSQQLHFLPGSTSVREISVFSSESWMCPCTWTQSRWRLARAITSQRNWHDFSLNREQAIMARVISVETGPK